MGRALGNAVRHHNAAGIDILRDAEKKIDQRGVLDPEAIYKIAQAYAALGEKQSALRVLRRSVENGFFCYPYMVADPLLDSVRSDFEFAALLTSARRQHEAFKAGLF